MSRTRITLSLPGDRMRLAKRELLILCARIGYNP
jgi:hypothetical protein